MLFIYLSLFLLFLCWWITSPRYWRNRGIKYITPLPIFGNLLPVLTKGIDNCITDICKCFPNEKLIGFHFFTKPTLIVMDPDLIEKILIKHFDHFTSHGVYGNQERDPMASNLFYIHGEEWKDVRRKLSPFFTPAKVRAIIDYVDISLPKAYYKINKCISNGNEVEIHQLMFEVNCDLIAQGIFGVETDVFTNEKSYFRQIEKKILGLNFTINSFAGIISPTISEFFKLTCFNEECTMFVTDLITKAMDYRKANNIVKQDFLQGLMEIMINDSCEEGRKFYPDKTRVPRYDLKRIIAQAMIIYAAGIDNSAVTISYLLYELALNQDLQHKCRQELAKVLNRKGSNIGVDDVKELKLLSSALKETMRFHNTITVLPRKCTKTYKFEDVDLVMNPGDFLIIPVTFLQRSAKFYSDPDVFKAERFNKGATTESASYLAWGLGYRDCIGKSLAWLKMLVISARLIHDYRFTLSRKTSVPIKKSRFKLIITPKEGVWLNMQLINERKRFTNCY